MVYSTGLEVLERDFANAFDKYRLATELRRKSALTPAAHEAEQLDRMPLPAKPPRTREQRSNLRRSFGWAFVFVAAGLTASATVPVAVVVTSVMALMVSAGELVKNALRFADDELERGRVQDAAVEERNMNIARLRRKGASEVAKELDCDQDTIELSLDRRAIVNLRLKVSDLAERLWSSRGWSAFTPDDAAFERLHRDLFDDKAAPAEIDLVRRNEPRGFWGPEQTLGRNLNGTSDGSL